MNRALMSLLWALSLVSLGTSPTGAQGFTRRALPGGEVTGLEMSVEGPLQVVPGQTARYFVTVYEVVRDRDYRPAANATVHALAAFQFGEPLAQIETDDEGRAEITFEVPDDTSGFALHLDARSHRRGIRRRFEVHVSAHTPQAMTLATTRGVQPGARFVAFGQLRGASPALRTAPVTVELFDGQRRLQTERVRAHDGRYAATLRAPSRPGTFAIRAMVDEGPSANAGVTVEAPQTPTLLAHAVPDRRVARAGETLEVTVQVTDAQGEPLEGAEVRGLTWPRDVPPAERLRTTDAEGRARLPWVLPRDGRDRAELEDRVRVIVPGVGETYATARVRMDRGPATRVRAESGALIPGVPSRLFVRAVGADGAPLVGAPVRLSAPRLGSLEATTDDDGVAMLEGTLREEGRIPPDACGGATALAVELRVGDRSESHCVPVDPDGTVRVRAEASAEGGVDVVLASRASVRRAPLRVTLLRRLARPSGADARWLPVADRILAADTRRTHFDEPVREGTWQVRVRPLVGANRAEARGGTTWVVRPATRAPLTLDVDEQTVRLSGAAGESIVYVLPAHLAHSLAPPVAPQEGALATLARQHADTPSDRTCPHVLRGRELVATPADPEPARFGLLRDPWRQRALYHRGRLALVIRAIEDRVRAASEQGDVREVAVARGRGMGFHRAILEGIDEGSLGPEGARDLGGLPLTIAHLEAIDPAFTFDRMAHRITRARLLEALVSLRDWVHENDHDLSFARVGNPADWLAVMLAEGAIEEGALRDGWGRAMALRPARGGRARFGTLEPVRGFELLSAGADGRFGTGDDVWDPTARVLPSNSLYADAMDEDGLLARLGGVALGRARLSVLAEQIALGDYESHGGAASGGHVYRDWDDVPHALDEGRWATPRTGLRPEAFVVASAPVELELPSSAGTYRVVAGGLDGRRHPDARRDVRWGGSLELRAALPRRLRVDESLSLRVTIVRGEDELDAPLLLTLASRTEDAEGAVRFGPTEVRMEAGERRQVVEVPVVARAAGRHTVHFGASAEGREVWSAEQVIRAQAHGARRTRWASALVDGAWSLDVPLDASDRERHARVVLVDPARLRRDPLFARALRDRPGLRGWAQVIDGSELGRDLAVELERADLLTPEEAAGALVASAALPPIDGVSNPMGRAEHALVRATRRGSGTLAEQARLLAVLSPIAAGPPVHQERPSARRSFDVVARVQQLRTALWDAPREHAEDDVLLAQAAAALLLADPSDDSGRAFFLRVADRLAGEGEARWVRADDPIARVAGTAALALAADQLGRDELRAQLARGVAHRSWHALLDAQQADPPVRHRSRRRGEDDDEPPEPRDRGFWLLAASAFGALGEVREDTRVTFDGAAAALVDGAAEVALTPDDDHLEAELRVEGGAVWARLEVRATRAIATTPDAEEGASDGDEDERQASASGLVPSIDGVVGRVGEVAGLEVSVRALRAVEDGVVAIQLPAGAIFTAAAGRAVSSDDEVRGVVPPDHRGQIRVRLGAMEAGQRVRFPLPLRWIASGPMRGLGMATWSEAAPWLVTAVEGRELVVE